MLARIKSVFNLLVIVYKNVEDRTHWTRWDFCRLQAMHAQRETMFFEKEGECRRIDFMLVFKVDETAEDLTEMRSVYERNLMSANLILDLEDKTVSDARSAATRLRGGSPQKGRFVRAVNMARCLSYASSFPFSQFARNFCVFLVHIFNVFDTV